MSLIVMIFVVMSGPGWEAQFNDVMPLQLQPYFQIPVSLIEYMIPKAFILV